MSDILMELYYGKINPSDKHFENGSEYDKELKKSLELERNLFSLLNEDEKKLLDDLLSMQNSLDRISECDVFIDGFCLGMRIAIEVL